MRTSLTCLVASLMLWAPCSAESGQTHHFVFQRVPHTKDLEVLCWEAEGISQIIVVHTDASQPISPLWQSPIEEGYAPKIRFIDEIRLQDVPLILVERQEGASISRLDILGMSAGKMIRLSQISGFKFDIAHLDGHRLPSIIAHQLEDHADVGKRYDWNGEVFVDETAKYRH